MVAGQLHSKDLPDGERGWGHLWQLQVRHHGSGPQQEVERHFQVNAPPGIRNQKENHPVSFQAQNLMLL